jgi:CHAT domain-containing protein
VKRAFIAFLTLSAIGLFSMSAPVSAKKTSIGKGKLVLLRAQLVQSYGKVQLGAAFKIQKRIRRLHLKMYGRRDSRTLQAISSCATLASVTGAFSEAKSFLDDAVSLSKTVHGEGSRQHINVLVLLVHHYAGVHDHDRARALEDKVLDLHERAAPRDPALHANSLQVLGSVAMNRHETSLAKLRLMKALALLEKAYGESAAQLTSVYTVLGTLHWQMGERDRAVEWWDRLVKVQEKAYGKDSLQVGGSLLLWAGYFRRSGDEGKADPLERRAIGIYRRGMEQAGSHKTLATQRTRMHRQPLINLLLGRGELVEAERLLNAAIRESELQPPRSQVSNLNNYFGLVDLYRQQKRYKEALNVLDRIARIQDQSWGENFSNNSLWSRARILIEAGDYRGAHKSFTTLLKGRKKIYGARHPNVGFALEGLTRSAMGLGRGHEAFKRLKLSLDMMEEEIQRNLAIGNEADNRAFIASKAYQVDLALSLHQIHLPQHRGAARLAMETLLRRKARALDAAVDTRAALRSKLNGEARKRFDRLTVLRARLAHLVVSGPKTVEPGAFPKKVNALQEKIRQAEMTLRRSSHAFKNHQSMVSFEAVQKAIPADASLVEFVVMRPFDSKAMNTRHPARYMAYVLSRESESPKAFDLGEASVIDAQIGRFRRQLSSSESIGIEEEAQRTYKLLFKQLEAEVSGKKQLILSPDGALNLLPFGALMNEQGQYLIRGQTVTYVTSGRDLLRSSVGVQGASKTTIFADPTFEKLDPNKKSSHRGSRSVDFGSMRWSSLPATGKEAEALEKIIKGAVVYRGVEATEERMKALRSPQILHVATHGFFLKPTQSQRTNPGDGWGTLRVQATGEENPLLRSGLILAGPGERTDAEDGVLTALEASSMELGGTELVVLSACDTGVGDISLGDGVHGLRRALVVAGAKSLLMSLWKVDDDATRHLMSGYYRKLATGLSSAAALRQIQLAMSRSERYSHPMYWAAFIPVGVSEKIQLN